MRHFPVLAIAAVLSAPQCILAQASLGVSVSEVVAISEVNPGGPASVAGLQPGDILIEVNGKPVANSDDLRAALNGATPGRPLPLKVYRAGRTLALTAPQDAAKVPFRPGAQTAPPPEPEAPAPAPPASRPGRRPAAPPVLARANQVTGRVTDSAGKPLANANIAIDGITDAGQHVGLTAKTRADGSYVQPVPSGSYRVTQHSWLPVTYNGRSYVMPLVLADGDSTTSFPSTEPIVRNLVWKIQGLRQGSTEPNHYMSQHGTYISLTCYKDAKTDAAWGPDFTIEFTLTPNGPLIDGSQGKPVVYRMKKSTFDTWIDIPIGDYTATAKAILPNGQTRPAQIASHPSNPTNGVWGSSAQVQFPAEGAVNNVGWFGAAHYTLGARP